VTIQVVRLLVLHLHSLFEHVVSMYVYYGTCMICGNYSVGGTSVAQRCFRVCCIHISYIEYSWFLCRTLVNNDLWP
jgi:hypothetical protein